MSNPQRILLTILAAMTSLLTQNLASHKESLRMRTEQIDRLNEQIREQSAQATADLVRFQELRDRVKARSDRQAKIANLQRAISTRRAAQQNRRRTASNVDVQPAWLDESSEDILSFSTPDGTPNSIQRQFIEANLPSSKALHARLKAYMTHNANLRKQADDLKSQSIELEALYRRVVSLCTGVPEEKVDESLPALVAAVESERGGLLAEQEVGRVRDFLRRVDGSEQRVDG